MCPPFLLRGSFPFLIQTNNISQFIFIFPLILFDPPEYLLAYLRVSSLNCLALNHQLCWCDPKRFDRSGVNDLPPGKTNGFEIQSRHFVKPIYETPDTKMLDIGYHWGFGMPSVSITLELKILTALLTKLQCF